MGLKRTAEALHALLPPVPRALLRRPLRTLDALRFAARGSPEATARGPVRVQIEITSVCTFDCVMCNRHNLKQSGVLQRQMPLDLFRKIIAETQPQYVTVSGLGDPLLYPHLGTVLKELREQKIVVSLTSNLPHVTEKNLAALVEWPPDIFSFSLHAGTREIFNAITRSEDFDKSIQNFSTILTRLDTKKTYFRISCALQQLNLEDYDAVWSWIERWDLVDHFHLMPVHDFLIDVPGVAGYKPTEEQKRSAAESVERALGATQDPRKRQFLRTWRERIDKVPSTEQPVSSAPCMVPWYTTYITYSGTVVPCCFLTQPRHELGDASVDGFHQIWSGQKYQQFRHALMTRRETLAGCDKCRRRDPLPLKLGKR